MSRVRIPAGMSAQRADYILGAKPDFRQAVLAKNPTNYWPANEGYGTPRDIVSGSATSIVGSLSWVPPSLQSQGPALDFVNVATRRLVVGPLSDNGVVTWQVAFQADSYDRMLLGAAASAGYLYILNSTQIRMQTTAGTTNPTWTVSGGIPLGTWMILHIVRTSTTSATLYVNGVSQGAQPIDTSPFNVGYIGRYQPASGFDMDGRINHVARWSGVALSTGQIAELASRWASTQNYDPVPALRGTLIGGTAVTAGSTMGSNAAFFRRLYVPAPTVINRLSVYIVTSSGNIDVGLYDDDGTGGDPGTRLASLGSTASPGTGWQTFSIPSTTVDGVFYGALVPDNATFSAYYLDAGDWINPATGALIASSTYDRTKASSFPLPSTVSALSATGLGFLVVPHYV